MYSHNCRNRDRLLKEIAELQNYLSFLPTSVLLRITGVAPGFCHQGNLKEMARLCLHHNATESSNHRSGFRQEVIQATYPTRPHEGNCPAAEEAFVR